MKQRPAITPGVMRAAPKAFFILCALLCLALLFVTTGTITDSDAAAELILGKMMAHDGHLSPYSTDWYYSTELTVFNNHLVYSLLFRLTDSFFLVRLLGSVFMCALLALSFGVLSWGAGFGAGTFWLGAGALLLPVSVAYGRIVLMHQYYTVHLMRAMVIVGMILRLYREPRCKREGLLIAVLMAVSFFSGLAGPRQLAVTGIPLTLSVLWQRVVRFEKPRRQDGWLLLSMAFIAAGYLFNSHVLAQYYRFSVHDQVTLQTFHWTQLLDGFEYLIELCGYRAGAKAMSAIGVLSVAGIFALLIMLWASVRACSERLMPGEPSPAILSRVFACAVFAVQITGHLMFGVEYPLYYIPVIVFALPSFFACIHQREGIRPRHRLLLAFVLTSMLANSLVTLHWFVKQPDNGIRYRGILFENAHIVQDLDGVKRFLYENDTMEGYATYWNANVLTEMSNGDITVNPFVIITGERMMLQNWLTSPSSRRIRGDRIFLILRKEEKAEMGYQLEGIPAIAQYEDGLFTAYVYPKGALDALLVAVP